jgi:UDP:flavonoid glycosyltransferase YjiC (YdhE family)
MQDQPYWGQRLYEMGIGPKPIPRRKLTAENLAQHITIAVRNQTIRERAKQVGQKIRDEDGVERTVEVLENYAGQH